MAAKPGAVAGACLRPERTPHPVNQRAALLHNMTCARSSHYGFHVSRPNPGRTPSVHTTLMHESAPSTPDTHRRKTRHTWVDIKNRPLHPQPRNAGRLARTRPQPRPHHRTLQCRPCAPEHKHLRRGNPALVAELSGRNPFVQRTCPPADRPPALCHPARPRPSHTRHRRPSHTPRCQPRIEQPEGSGMTPDTQHRHRGQEMTVEVTPSEGVIQRSTYGTPGSLNVGELQITQ